MKTATRRTFLRGAAVTTGVVLAAGCAGTARSASSRGAGAEADDAGAAGGGEEDVSPAEDLMREHGLLNRLLLVYEEAAGRLERGDALDVQAVARGAGIVRTFVEDYHEKLEETHLFPRFEKAGKLVELVAVLRRQHDAGRLLTDRTTALASASTTVERAELASALRRFIRMYRPHEAREDTVLFPAFRELVTSREWDLLGERFEEEERARFGARGFEDMVGRVADLERALGIDDLAKFTPAV